MSDLIIKWKWKKAAFCFQTTQQKTERNEYQIQIWWLIVIMYLKLMKFLKYLVQTCENKITKLMSCFVKLYTPQSFITSYRLCFHRKNNNIDIPISSLNFLHLTINWDISSPLNINRHLEDVNNSMDTIASHRLQTH